MQHAAFCTNISTSIDKLQHDNLMISYIDWTNKPEFDLHSSERRNWWTQASIRLLANHSWVFAAHNSSFPFQLDQQTAPICRHQTGFATSAINDNVRSQVTLTVMQLKNQINYKSFINGSRQPRFIVRTQSSTCTVNVISLKKIKYSNKQVNISVVFSNLLQLASPVLLTGNSPFSPWLISFCTFIHIKHTGLIWTNKHIS